MPRLPSRTPADLVRLLVRHGFLFKRQSGSHAIYKHPDGRWAIVPMHRKDLKKGTLSHLLKDAGLEVEDLYST